MSEHLDAVPEETVLKQRLGECVRSHGLCAAQEELQNTLACKILKVMPDTVDVLSVRAELWKTCKFKCTRVVLKYLAVDVRFSA